MKTFIYIFILGLFMGSSHGWAQAPETWQVDPFSYQYTMNITGAFVNGCDFSSDPNDVVAAFVEDEVRGVGKFATDFEGNALVFMTVFSNINAGETVRFEVYDQSSGKVVKVKESLTFNENEILGTPDLPYQFYETLPIIEGEVFEQEGHVGLITNNENYDFQWLRNGVPIEGADSIAYDACISGNYQAEITNSPGCVYVTEPYFFDRPPLAIQLSDTSIEEFLPIPSPVGVLSTNSCELKEGFSYDLVPGEGSEDNASFRIKQDTLMSNAVFERDRKEFYRVRIQTKDELGRVYSQAFIIRIRVGLGNCDRNVSVYPNPNYSGIGTLSLDNNQLGLYTLSIYAVNRELVKKIEYTKTESFQEYSFGTDLSQGMYFLEIKTAKQRCIKKWIQF